MPLARTPSKVTLTLPNGASAQILLYGATVISWRAPSQLDAGPPLERLYTSPKAFLDGSRPVRGGIPVVFPVFGAPSRPEHALLAQHGFARSEFWRCDDRAAPLLDTAEAVAVRFLLEPSPGLQARFPAPFSLAYTVTLAPHALTTALHVANPAAAAAALSFQALLHTYIRADTALSTVTPLKGLAYINKLKPGCPEEREARAAVDVREPADFIYKAAGGAYEVSWGGGLGVEVTTAGFQDVVLWNPGKHAGSKIPDLEDGGWDLFIALEPGAASYWIDLDPGDSWTGQQTLTVI